jgi:hypothetical protein
MHNPQRFAHKTIKSRFLPFCELDKQWVTTHDSRLTPHAPQPDSRDSTLVDPSHAWATAFHRTQAFCARVTPNKKLANPQSLFSTTEVPVDATLPTTRPEESCRSVKNASLTQCIVCDKRAEGSGHSMLCRLCFFSWNAHEIISLPFQGS